MIHFLHIGHMKVCLGGTFDVLHDGHKRLITTARDLAGPSGTVVIGITKGSLASKQRTIGSYQQRKKAIKEFLSLLSKTPQVVLTIYHIASGAGIELSPIHPGGGFLQ
jgi:cytidyltransferase-like protein